MITGIIGPKGRPGFLLLHGFGHTNLEGQRRFVVDERPREPGEAPACVVDQAGKPLVLDRATYDDIRKEIAAGAEMFIEPDDTAAADLEEAREEARRLRAKLEEQRAAFNGSWEQAQREITAARQTADEANAQAEQNIARAEAVAKDATGKLQAANQRIADLEGQLAAAEKPAPAPAAPAAAPDDKVKKPK